MAPATMEETMNNTMNLGDVPNLDDLPQINRDWEDGWYAGTFLEFRTFTDKNGNERLFESNDTPAQTTGRNIRLQVELKRQDGRIMGLGALVNYRPEDYTQETVEQIKANPDDSNLKRAYLALSRLKTLAMIAGGRQLQRSQNGGFVLTPLFGKTAYFRLGQQKDSVYKEIKDFKLELGPRTKAL